MDNEKICDKFEELICKSDDLYRLLRKLKDADDELQAPLNCIIRLVLDIRDSTGKLMEDVIKNP